MVQYNCDLACWANVTNSEQCHPRPEAEGEMLPCGDIGCVALHGSHHLYNVLVTLSMGALYALYATWLW